MSSLIKRCQRRWSLRLRPWGDSKVSPYWRKRDVRHTARAYGEITAEGLVRDMAENNARADFENAFGRDSYSYEAFSVWFTPRQQRYYDEALNFLNEWATVDEIDEAIETEIDCWEP